MPKILFCKYYPEKKIAELLHKNWDFDAIDFIETEFLDLSEFEEKIQNSDQNFIISSIKGAQQYLKYGGSGKVVCVGNESFNLLKNNHIEVLQTLPNAQSLVDWMIENANKSVSWIYLCSEIRQHTIYEKLTASGFQITEIIAYKTLEKSVKISQNYDAYAFFSPSAVKSYLNSYGFPQKAVIFALGETTALALKSRVNQAIIVAEQPNLDSLIKTLNQYGNSPK